MRETLKEKQRPTIATVVTGIVTSLVFWGLDALPETVPEELLTQLRAGALLLAVGVGVAAGQIAQWVGDKAPWTHSEHLASVSRAVMEERWNPSKDHEGLSEDARQFEEMEEIPAPSDLEEEEDLSEEKGG